VRVLEQALEQEQVPELAQEQARVLEQALEQALVDSD
jgi:hypothetical protein